MTSDEINKKINEIADEVEKYDFNIADSGKTIPYIGWYWRNVNWNRTTYTIGRIPGTFNGFMENNKWDYPTISLNEKEWAEIKRLIIAVCENTNKDTLTALNNYIQNLGVSLD